METSAPALHRVRSWLGLERNIVVMLLTFLLVGMGEELWVRFIPKYLELLGAGAWVVAWYGTLRDLLDALYAYPGGWLTDRLGRRAALALFALLAIAGYGVFWLAPSWPWILGGTVLVMAWSSLTLPAIFAVVGDSLSPARRATGFGVHAVLKRVPIVLAPPLGGWMIATLGLARGIRAGLAVTVLLACGGIAILWRSYAEVARPVHAAGRIRDLWREMDGGLKRLLVADCLARWAEGIPKVFLILFVIDVLGGTPAQFGWLTSVQMIAATIVYIPLAKMADRMNRKPFVLVTFGFFALFPLALAAASGPLWLAGAFIIAGLRETGEPARKALILDLAAASVRGRAVGLYYLLRGLAVFPASLVGGWLWTLDRRLPFYIAFAVGVAGFLVHAHWGPADAPRRPSAERSPS
jgi:MFS family permease